MSTLKHGFVSSVPDSPDPTIVQGSHWNADHGFNPPIQGLIQDPLGNNNFVGVSGTGIPINPGDGTFVGVNGNPGQYLTRRYNTLTPVYEFKDKAQLNRVDFDFPPQLIHQNLTSGATNIITCNPLPTGITAMSVTCEHPIRIIDAVGGNEVVKITAVSGSTFSCIPSLAHTSGNWSIASATGGIIEAVNNPAAYIDIWLGSGDVEIYGAINIRGNGARSITIRGGGAINTRLMRNASYPAGDILYYNSETTGGGTLLLQDFTVVNSRGFNNTSGAGLRLYAAGFMEILVYRVNVYDGKNPVILEGVTGSDVLDQCKFIITKPYWSAFGSGHAIESYCPFFHIFDCYGVIENPNATTTGAGLLITRCDGAFVTGGSFSGRFGVMIDPDPAFTMNFVYLVGLIIDGTWNHGIYVVEGTHNVWLSQFFFDRIHVATQFGDVAAMGIYVANEVQALSIINCNISGSPGNGIQLGGAGLVPKGVIINGNQINNCKGHGIFLTSSANKANCVITNNVLGNNIDGYGTTTQLSGVYFAGAGAFKGYTITNNNMQLTTPILKDAGSTLEQVIVDNNVGLNDISGQLGIATANNAGAWQFYSTMELVGSGNLSSITPVWDGREVKIIKRDAGTINIITGGNIGSTLSLAQGQMRTMKYSGIGSLWYGQ